MQRPLIPPPMITQSAGEECPPLDWASPPSLEEEMVDDCSVIEQRSFNGLWMVIFGLSLENEGTRKGVDRIREKSVRVAMAAR